MKIEMGYSLMDPFIQLFSNLIICLHDQLCSCKFSVPYEDQNPI